MKLATVVFVAVRGFQYAWPPLAYSIESDEEAARLYSLVTTYYSLATGPSYARLRCSAAGWSAAGGPKYFGAYRALPWLALGWALYGLYLVFIAIAGRARMTSRNFPAAAVGLAVNIVLLLLLVPHGGANLGIAGAGLALCGAYAAMLVVMYLLTRSLFRVGFQWRRLAQLDGDLRRGGRQRQPAAAHPGFAGLALRVLWLALVPALLLLTRFFAPARARAGPRADSRREQARACLPLGAR